MNGLSSVEAEKLLSQYGLNEIAEGKKFQIIAAFANQFKNFLIVLLILAGGVSYFFGDTVESLFIFLIVILNALFGLYQEAKAEKSLQALKKMTKTIVRVKRDNTEQEIDSKFLVPGDLIYLEEGAKIPADAKLVEAWNLEVNEASLTGESLPVKKGTHKDHDKNLFMGTIVARGRVWAVVTATGTATKFGQIAKTLTTIAEIKTPMQKRLEKLSKQIGSIGILASVLVFELSFVREKTLIESFLFAISLAVAAVPEGLPAVMTITLAIGVERMAGKGAIIRKLNAIEALGSITLLATDKTGTLTTNKMEVTDYWVKNKKDLTEIMLDGILCSTANVQTKAGKLEVLGDPTEGALLLMAIKNKISISDIRTKWKILEEVPFDTYTKIMKVVVTNGKNKIEYSKGAPETIIKNCQMSAIDRKKAVAIYEEYAKKGLRTLAFAKDKRFLGLTGLSDPLREEVKEAVVKAKSAGVRVVMITGDSELTARAIGFQSGIADEKSQVMLGKDIDNLDDEKLKLQIGKINIYARTTPEHKYRLVRLFQSLGEVTAVTGDGVNDALALKQADVGVAMGITGTDVAKETADMIVTDDNFGTIVTAIEEGRNIFRHIKNSVIYLLACNVGEVLYILTAVVFRLPVLLPLQILYMNLATDGVPALSFAFSPNQKNIMKELPRKGEEILTKLDIRYIVLTGILTAVMGLVSVWLFVDHEIATTVLFTALILVQQIILVDIWIYRKPLFKSLKLLIHPVFLLAFWLPIIIHPLLLYLPNMAMVFEVVPISLTQLGFGVVVGIVSMIILELSKKHEA